MRLFELATQSGKRCDVIKPPANAGGAKNWIEGLWKSLNMLLDDENLGNALDMSLFHAQRMLDVVNIC